MMHVLPVTGQRGWGFNGSVERPTFTPSILARFNFNNGVPHGICHSFVREGKIEFLSDCTHESAGKTIELPEIKEP